MLIKKIKQKDIFTKLSIVIGIIILMPLVNILFELLKPDTLVWEHIRTYLLFEYIKNSIFLILLTSSIAITIGVSAAYFISRYSFKGRKWLSWAMVLPLAIPSYIAGYIYSDMFSYSGSMTRMMRNIGINFELNMMNIVGASVLFAFTLYPYIYLITLSSLSRQSASYKESSILLGASRYRSLFKVTLPLLRPAIIAGTLLVILETLNDYGLVHYFNVRVFSFAIFNAWFSLGDVTSAIRLSAYLMFIVFFMILIEKALRGRRKYQLNVRSKMIARKKVKPLFEALIIFVLVFILIIGFFIPVAQMIWYMTLTYQKAFNIELIYAMFNTVTNALLASFVIVVIGIIMVNFNRMQSRSKLSKLWVKISNLGYAIPGAVIAVLVHIFFVDLDRFLYPLYRLINPDSKTLVITMSLFTLIFAYIIRFLSIGFNSIESQYDKVGDKFTESAYTLGSSKLDALFRVDLPLIYPGLITAFILVFVDVIKELPLTLILRPVNYESLSTMVYVYSRNEMIQESSVPSLILIIIASILIYFITHYKKGIFSHVY